MFFSFRLHLAKTDPSDDGIFTYPGMGDVDAELVGIYSVPVPCILWGNPLYSYTCPFGGHCEILIQQTGGFWIARGLHMEHADVCLLITTSTVMILSRLEGFQRLSVTGTLR